MSISAPHSVLVINASGRRNGSVSRRLAQQTISALRGAGAALSIVERDLADGMPFVDEAWIGANFTPAEERTAAQSARLSFSDTLVEELKAADLIIIATPVYNFSIPAALKAWIDQIARARLTFKYTETGPVGLLDGKRAIIALASGGTEAGSAADFATGYLKYVLSFVGVTDVSVIAADRLMADADAANARTDSAIGEFAAQFGKARAA